MWDDRALDDGRGLYAHKQAITEALDRLLHASKADARGMGAGSGTMAQSHDNARARAEHLVRCYPEAAISLLYDRGAVISTLREHWPEVETALGATRGSRAETIALPDLRRVLKALL